MDTAEGNIEDKACESSMVVVTNTTVHPRTMVVHLLTAPGQREEEMKKGEGKGGGGGERRGGGGEIAVMVK